MARPHGPLALALLAAAAAGPGSVRELAARSLVGKRSAQYTASRLLATGYLIQIDERRPVRPGRPVGVLALPAAATTCTDDTEPGADLAAALSGWRVIPETGFTPSRKRDSGHP